MVTMDLETKLVLTCLVLGLVCVTNVPRSNWKPLGVDSIGDNSASGDILESLGRSHPDMDLDLSDLNELTNHNVHSQNVNMSTTLFDHNIWDPNNGLVLVLPFKPTIQNYPFSINCDNL